MGQNAGTLVSEKSEALTGGFDAMAAPHVEGIVCPIRSQAATWLSMRARWRSWCNASIFQQPIGADLDRARDE